jgi:hypothetical protein
MASQLAKRNGWHLTIDAFASESNSFMPRFFARYVEPSAEAEDAFTVGDWDQSTCPACGLTHREVFAFPPPALLNHFVAKARTDGVRAIMVTPLAVSAPYWNKLLRASTINGTEVFVRLRAQQNCPPAPTPRASSPSSPSISRRKLQDLHESWIYDADSLAQEYRQKCEHYRLLNQDKIVRWVTVNEGAVKWRRAKEMHMLQIFVELQIAAAMTLHRRLGNSSVMSRLDPEI